MRQLLIVLPAGLASRCSVELVLHINKRELTCEAMVWICFGPDQGGSQTTRILDKYSATWRPLASVTGATITMYLFFKLLIFSCDSSFLTEPEVVKSLSVSEITTSSVYLTWTKPEGNSTYYRVQWTAGTNNWGVTVSETEMNVTSLTAGVQYTFTIIAVAGDSETVGEAKTVSKYTSKMCSASLSAFNIICCPYSQFNTSFS